LGGNRAKEFISLYNKIGARRGYSEVWSDLMLVIACSISNTVDATQLEQRFKRAKNAADKYSDDEQKIFLQLMGIIRNELSENPDQDFLGDIYMELGLGKKSNAQFFTPYNVSKMMAMMSFGNPAEEIKQRGMVTINDSCCGAGAMLIAAANICIEQGVDIGRDVLFVAQDIDPLVAMMCYIQLSMLRCAGYVLVGDSLRNEPVGPENTWLLPSLFRQDWVDLGVMQLKDAA